jgi:cysteinyl-tRNA synthetase
MHNGFVRINEEKMSKSLGNFFTVREVLKQYRPEIIRFFILSSHYRSPLNYSDESLNDAAAGLTRLYTALRDVEIIETDIDSEFKTRFQDAMNDDFNTPVALAVLFDVARELNKTKSPVLGSTLKSLASVLGLLQDDSEAFLKGGNNDDAEIEAQIQARIDAKKAKNWALADQIRDELKAKNVILEDSPDGLTRWRKE